VLVFNRAERAAAWTDLLAHAFDVQEPERNFPQVRLSGPDQADRVFLTDPRNGGGVATVIGHRGPVGFQLQTTFQRGDSRLPADRVDLDARAEPLARQMAADWARWLEGALTAAS
jgi:hypothetical protein